MNEDNKQLWINPVAGVVAHHKAGEAFFLYARVHSPTGKVSEGDEGSTPRRRNVIRCPMCDEPIEVLMNGLAHCVNLIKDFKTIEEWRDRSCLLAQHNISLPNLVWLRFRDLRDETLTTVRKEATEATFKKALGVVHNLLPTSAGAANFKETAIKALEAAVTKGGGNDG